MKTTLPADNPHWWIPNPGPEPYEEVCHLCGVLSRGKNPDPPAAKLACPEPWPERRELTEHEMEELLRLTDEAGGGPMLIELPARGGA